MSMQYTVRYAHSNSVAKISEQYQGALTASGISRMLLLGTYFPKPPSKQPLLQMLPASRNLVASFYLAPPSNVAADSNTTIPITSVVTNVDILCVLRASPVAPLSHISSASKY